MVGICGIWRERNLQYMASAADITREVSPAAARRHAWMAASCDGGKESNDEDDDDAEVKIDGVIDGSGA